MLEKIKPQQLFFYKRLDLIVKYLYAKDLLNDYHNKEIENLYIRHILMRTGGIEPFDCITGEQNKSTIEDYLKSFKKLLFSIKSENFNKEYPIPLANNNTILNGAHRIACSMALNQEIYVEKFDREGLYWDFNWFDKNGFSTEDKMRILKGFVEINQDNSAILVVWNPMFKYLDHLKVILNKELDIVGEVELDFENNFVAFNNVILDIYEANSLNKSKYETIISKAELLQSCHLSFKVLVLTNQEKNKDKNINDIVKNIKQKVREDFDFALPKEVFATIHSNDDVRELLHLSDTLLSVNNIRQLKKRLSYKYDERFLEFCNECKKVCKNNDINIEDICIVGSAPMAVYGIKMVGDIDFVTKYSYREKFGDSPTHLSDNIDIASRNYHRKTDNNVINDDLLILDDNYHFMFNGLKFANLEIIKERKQNSKREKDLRHVRKIELFENFIGTINQEQIFKLRVMQEEERRKKIKKIESNSNNVSKIIKEETKKVEIKNSDASDKKINCNKKTNCKKYPKWFVNFCCWFIAKKKNRKHFRKKYSK